MKTKAGILNTLAIFLILVSLSSCRKHTCGCVVEYEGPPSYTGGQTEFTVTGSKKKAKAECESHSTEMVAGSKTTCGMID